MKNENEFIITVDYLDALGTATEILGKIAMPYMNFSSKSQADFGETFNQINDALCFGNLKTFYQFLYSKLYLPGGADSSRDFRCCRTKANLLCRLFSAVFGWSIRTIRRRNLRANYHGTNSTRDIGHRNITGQKRFSNG